MGWEACEEKKIGLDARLLDRWDAGQSLAPAAVPRRAGLLTRLTEVVVDRALGLTAKG